MSATLKIPYAQPSFFGTEEAYLVQAFRSTWISGGTFVDRFEEDFRRYCGTRYAVTSSNGTTALHIDRKSTRLNSSHGYISYAVFCLKKKKKILKLQYLKSNMTRHLVR